MYSAITESIEKNRVTKYSLSNAGRALSFAETINLWQTDVRFRLFFSELLTASPFEAFRWETPSLSIDSANQKFQFVLLNAPSFVTRTEDRGPFESKFSSDESDAGIVEFCNLSGDATMIVPSPRAKEQVYGHLAAFLRLAPKQQVDALWQVVGRVIHNKISPAPIWLNTAGGGVAWLHVRLDSKPKYYGYKPFKRAL